MNFRGAAGYLARARRLLSEEATRALFRRPLAVRSALPLISFTFDDFPRSAFEEAGSILCKYGVRGTYYVSLGLMGKENHLGPMFQVEDLQGIVQLGHELGCHTFAHCHSGNTPPEMYERSILDNERALQDVIPGAVFKTFSYPYCAPKPGVKRVASKHFLGCRGGGLKPGRFQNRHGSGGQTFNSGVTDLNLLCAFFMEQSRDNLPAVKNLIEQNARARGWLIFATHDVRTDPSPYGCTPAFFEQVVQWSQESGARILPVGSAIEVLQASQPAN